MGFLKDIIISMRPRQWTKNTLLFAALIFSQHLLDVGYFLKSLAGFGLFCLVSGCVYLLNDVLDIKHDRTHPVKKLRPIPAGRISTIQALAISAVASMAGLILAFCLRVEFGIAICGYLVLQVLYCLVLKRVVLLDVFVIAFGFVIRAVAGAYAIHVVISPWLLTCTLLLSLFLALSKRRHELSLAEEGSSSRDVLHLYSLDMLDQMINIVGAGTVVSYLLYTMAGQTIEKFGTDKLILTAPFVLFGIFRYLFIVHKKNEGGSPEKVLLTDVPLIINILLYGLTAAAIIYFVGN
jgi:4-hydroxybenzoate polyprenyltransferase